LLLSNGYSFGQDGMCSCRVSTGRSDNLGEKSCTFFQKHDCASAECVYLFISIQPAIHVTSDTSKCNIVQHTVLSH